MASNIKDFLKGTRPVHTVGQVNSWNYDTFINGAVCDENLDNFTLGEIIYKSGTYESGSEGIEAHVKQATSTTEAFNAVLIATPEKRLNVGDYKEMLCDFYNEKGERATCIILNKNLTFQTSKFDASGVSDTPEIGQFATWNGTQFVLKASATGTEKMLFQVVDYTNDINYSIDDQELVMLTFLR